MDGQFNRRGSHDPVRPREKISEPKGLSGLGVVSVVCGLFGFLFPVASFFGIIAAASGIVRDRSDRLCMVGLCIALISVTVNAIDIIQACSSGKLSALIG